MSERKSVVLEFPKQAIDTAQLEGEIASAGYRGAVYTTADALCVGVSLAGVEATDEEIQADVAAVLAAHVPTGSSPEEQERAAKIAAAREASLRIAALEENVDPDPADVKAIAAAFAVVVPQ